jgi:hypothetical protein
MSLAQQMLNTIPSRPGYSVADLAACIDACLECAQVCTACADACLGEEMVGDLRSCITVDLGCADLCEATAAILSRQTGYDAALTQAALEACRQACGICAEECERHADMHQHCRICAEACRRCEQSCATLLAA